MAIDNETMQIIERCVARALNNATSLKDAAGEIAKGVTQYVGARYVPLFAAPLDWDSKREYEPLTIVLYQGASYTSRQYVPSGIDISNEQFWAVTGNYNAQVEQYRRETKEISDKCDTVVKNASDALALAQTNESNIAVNAAKLAGTSDSGLKTLITNEIERAKSNEASIKQTADSNSAAVQTLNENVGNLTGTVNTLSNTVNKQVPIIAKNTASNNKHEQQLAASADSGLLTLINSKFPIASDSIANGAVTAPKMATSAINSILQGYTVRRFDNTNSKADNTGLVCPSNGKLAGFYIVELGILVINVFEVTSVSNISITDFSLPTYVPSVSDIVQMAGFGVIYWDSSNNFANWSGVRYGNGRHIFTNSQYNSQFSSTCCIAYLKPYETSEQSANYANAVASNQII